MSLGKRLKSLRTKRKWTLKEVANKLELSSHSTYSNWEYDRTQPDFEMLKKIAELYEVSTDYLIDGPGEIENITDEESPIPPAVKAWLRADVDDLSKNEQEMLAEDLADYFHMRKKRILDKKNKQ